MSIIYYGMVKLWRWRFGLTVTSLGTSTVSLRRAALVGPPEMGDRSRVSGILDKVEKL